MKGNVKRAPPPVPDDSAMAMGHHDLNGNGNGNGNGSGHGLQFENDGLSGNGGGGGFGGDFGGDFGAFGAQEPDEATRLLIEQMMQQELCVKCKKQQGFELPCGCNVCGACARQYILLGITSKRWAKETLQCLGCKDGVIPLWVVKECGVHIL